MSVIISRGVTLRIPSLVGYRHRLTFRGALVPPAGGEQVTISAGGRTIGSTRTRADGTFRLTRRIRVPGPYAATWIRVDAAYGQDTYDAVVAFEKVNGLPRTGEVTPVLWRRLERASVPRARYGGDHVEVD